MIEHVDADRLRDLTLELVEIESPRTAFFSVSTHSFYILRSFSF